MYVNISGIGITLWPANKSLGIELAMIPVPQNIESSEDSIGEATSRTPAGPYFPEQLTYYTGTYISCPT